MKITFKGKTLAESSDTIVIEGNHYFPPTALAREYFTDSELHTVCVWKGDASYYNIQVDGTNLDSAAWYYPVPKQGSEERVGQPFANYVAFYLRNGVELSE